MKTLLIGSQVRFKKKYWDVRRDRIITDETYIYRGTKDDKFLLEDPRGNIITCPYSRVTLLGGYGRFEDANEEV